MKRLSENVFLDFIELAKFKSFLEMLEIEK